MNESIARVASWEEAYDRMYWDWRDERDARLRGYQAHLEFKESIAQEQAAREIVVPLVWLRRQDLPYETNTTRGVFVPFGKFKGLQLGELRWLDKGTVIWSTDESGNLNHQHTVAYSNEGLFYIDWLASQEWMWPRGWESKPFNRAIDRIVRSDTFKTEMPKALSEGLPVSGSCGWTFLTATNVPETEEKPVRDMTKPVWLVPERRGSQVVDSDPTPETWNTIGWSDAFSDDGDALASDDSWIAHTEEQRDWIKPRDKRVDDPTDCWLTAIDLSERLDRVGNSADDPIDEWELLLTCEDEIRSFFSNGCQWYACVPQPVKDLLTKSRTSARTRLGNAREAEKFPNTREGVLARHLFVHSGTIAEMDQYRGEQMNDSDSMAILADEWAERALAC